MYQGPWYDGTPLKEADEIAEQALIQFGSQLGDERSRILAMRERIMEQKAERDWVIAQFYDRKKDYGAARIYYQRIVKNYPASRASLRAHVRLEQIRNQPDSPPNRFQWLADSFAAEQ